MPVDARSGFGRPPGYDWHMAGYLEKWLKRTELQVVALVVVLILANHFLAWGLSVPELLAMAGVGGAYAISRGQAKRGTGSAGGFVLVELLVPLVGIALLGLALLSVSGCATLQSFGDQAQKARREIEGTLAALDGLLDACEELQDPQPAVCTKAEDLEEQLLASPGITVD